MGMGSATQWSCTSVLVIGLGMSGCKVIPDSPVSDAAAVRNNAMIVQADKAMAAGETDEALRLLALAIERNPTLTVAHMKMGEIYRQRGQNESALDSYESAARLEPRNFDAQYYHGVTLHLLERLSDAVRAYLRALAIRPDDFQANLNLAIAYLQLNEPRQALPYSERSVRLEPTSGPARANLGAVYGALGRHDDAVREYRSAAELMELTPDLLVNLADSLGKTGRFQEMENTLAAVLEMEATAAAWERLGFARFKRRDYSGAQEAFREAIELDGRHYPALNGLGVCLLNSYLVSDRVDDAARREAIDMLRQSLRINNRQPRIVELVSRYD